MKKIIDQLLNSDIDLITYISSLKKSTLEKIIEYASQCYYNTPDSIISDEIYDTLIDILKNKYPNSNILIKSGAVSKNNKFKLDYWLGSMNKIKPDTKELNIWKKKYNSPYYFSDKLDGVSALLIYNDNKISMYTRGDGFQGTNISNLSNYLTLPPYNDIYNYCKLNKIKGNKNLIAFRGELIIKKKIFYKIGIINLKMVEV
jgi:NAD-dependent DNA ligase